MGVLDKRKVTRWVDSLPVIDEKQPYQRPLSLGSFTSVLLDMDDLPTDATRALAKFWDNLDEIYRMDPSLFLPTSCFRRTIDIFKESNSINSSKDFVKLIEARILLKSNPEATPIPGAHAFFCHLSSLQIPWGIVIRRTQPLVGGWIKYIKLEDHQSTVTEEINRYEWLDSFCYLQDVRILGTEDEVLVVGDAPTGIRAAKAAGCKVLALTTNYTADELWNAGADWVVKDLEDVSVGFRRLRNEKRGVAVEIMDDTEIRGPNTPHRDLNCF